MITDLLKKSALGGEIGNKIKYVFLVEFCQLLFQGEDGAVPGQSGRRSMQLQTLHPSCLLLGSGRLQDQDVSSAIGHAALNLEHERFVTCSNILDCSSRDVDVSLQHFLVAKRE